MFIQCCWFNAQQPDESNQIKIALENNLEILFQIVGEALINFLISGDEIFFSRAIWGVIFAFRIIIFLPLAVFEWREENSNTLKSQKNFSSPPTAVEWWKRDLWNSTRLYFSFSSFACALLSKTSLGGENFIIKVWQISFAVWVDDRRLKTSMFGDPAQCQLKSIAFKLLKPDNSDDDDGEEKKKISCMIKHE